MTKILKIARSLHNDESGAALLEYTVLLGILAVAVIGFITTVATKTGTIWSNFALAY
jgi:pilus assembly protein Flp/PilA